jgi:hypothetical protein
MMKFRCNWFKQEANHKLINSVWNKEELPEQWRESIIVPVHETVDKTDCNNYRGISTKRCRISFTIQRWSYWGNISVGSDLPDELLIRFSIFVRYWRTFQCTLNIETLIFTFHVIRQSISDIRVESNKDHLSELWSEPLSKCRTSYKQ